MGADTAEQAKELGRKAAEQLRAGNKPAFAELLKRAKRLTPDSENHAVKSDASAIRRAGADEDIITPEELATRLKVTLAWIYEKRRPRCKNPIPAIPMGRGAMRFKWQTVVKWLEEQARADTQSIERRRNTVQVRKRKVAK
jgi:hypothetical protein